jgi:hypothetical protein
MSAYQIDSSSSNLTHIYVFRCEIRGSIQPQDKSKPKQAPILDDGSRLVKINGCQYCVKEDCLNHFPSHFVQATCIITKDLFDDGGEQDVEGDGTNWTGIYLVYMRLKRDVPQLLPIMRKRIKIRLTGIQKLCTNFFSRHRCEVCKFAKVQWASYVHLFVKKHPQITKKIAWKMAVDRRFRTFI